MMRRRFYLLIIIASVMLGNLYCGGGTDTGNPDIVSLTETGEQGMLACADAVFEEFELHAPSMPEKYLSGGAAQLDPTAYLASSPNLFLHKTGIPDTQVLNLPMTSNILQIRTRVDTVVLIDSLFVTDTLVSDYLTHDTTFMGVAGKDTLVVTNRKYETVIIADTIIKLDTLLTTCQDTIFYRVVNADSAPVALKNSVVAGSVQKVYMDAIQINISEQPVDSVHYSNAKISYKYAPWGMANRSTTNFTVTTDTGNVQMARKTFVDNVSVSETYSDADGDGYLYKSVQPSFLRSKFSGTYTQGNSVTSLTCVFDAGADGKFATTSDNRILTLSRFKAVDKSRVETITYTSPGFGSAGDTICFTIERIPEYGVLQYSSTKYRCRTGSDPLNHRQNILTNIAKEISNRSGKVQALSIAMVPDSTVTVSGFLSGGTVSARCEFNAAIIGIFEGRIDMNSRMLTGIYTENGVVYQVVYDRILKTLAWEKLK